MVVLAFNTAVPLIALLAFVTIAGALLLVGTRQSLVGTTLIGPWSWMVGSTIAIGLTEVALLIAAQDQPWVTAVRFAVATTCFCPLMSLLGAKRPQDKAWHFVVVSLWAILALPAFESLVLRHGQMPDVRGARSWFMLALVGLGIVNSLPTRHWLAGLVSCTGQTLMLAEFLPIIRGLAGGSAMPVGFICWVVAIATLMLTARRSRVEAEPLTTIWLDFRDSFGTLWALRVAERINAAASTSDWPVTLFWRGFVVDEGKASTPDDLSDEVQQPLKQTIDNLLRRFVSPAWIAARLGEEVDYSSDNERFDETRRT